MYLLMAFEAYLVSRTSFLIIKLILATCVGEFGTQVWALKVL